MKTGIRNGVLVVVVFLAFARDVTAATWSPSTGWSRIAKRTREFSLRLFGRMSPPLPEPEPEEETRASASPQELPNNPPK